MMSTVAPSSGKVPKSTDVAKVTPPTKPTGETPTTELYYPKMFFPVPEEAMDRLYYPVDFRDPEYPIEEAFYEACEYVRKIPTKFIHIPDWTRLRFYALFKQATEGDIDEKTVKQPSILRDWEGYWKVFGWRRMKGTPRETARDEYVKRLGLQISQRSTVRWAPPVDPWEAFDEGVRIVRILPKEPISAPDTLRAHFYALYKQATVGDLSTFQKSDIAAKNKHFKWLRERPSKKGSFDQLRYDAWMELAGTSSEEAMRTYCYEIYREACRFGGAWEPPGAPGHLDEIGNQLTSKDNHRVSASNPGVLVAQGSGSTGDEVDGTSDEKFFTLGKKSKK